VDIRSDLYSLGCTFYFLLTGRVPFPEGSALEKLASHRWEEPEPVERLRPDVPAGVSAVVRKLMAKKPEERYQTPAEVVAALVAASGIVSPVTAAEVPLAVPVAVPVEPEVPVAAVVEGTTPVIDVPRMPDLSSSLGWPLAIAGVVFGMVVLILSVVLALASR